MAVEAAFNGYGFGEDWVIEEIARPKPESRVAMEEPEGADGYFFRGATLHAQDVAVTLAPKAPGGLQGRLDRLMAALAVREPARLEFSDEGGRYRMCVPSGPPAMEEHAGFARVTVMFSQPSPALYGQAKTVALSTSSTSFEVGGTYPARPAVSSSNAVKSASGLWGVRFDNKGYMRVPLEVSSAASVGIDADARTAKANGSASMVTLDSDWAELAPGTHTARIDQGGGSATLSWVERWL